MLLRTIAALLATTTALAGCATTDRYYDRVIAYNEQTDAAYGDMILLNIIRSSYRMPTQYMDVSSIVGSNGATAGATFNGTPSPTGSAAAGLSYSSTFTAPVLNTKEFYQGILAPISPETLDYYFQTSRPLELVFNLMFDRVTVKTSERDCARRATQGRCVANFTNDPRNPQNFELFETMMRYLLMNGFSTERVSVKKPKDVVSTGKVSISVSSADAAPDARPSGSDTKAVRFCFHPVPGVHDVTISTALLCDNLSRRPIQNSDVLRLEDAIKIPFSERLAEDMRWVANKSDRKHDEGDAEQTRDFNSIIENLKGQPVEVVLRLRSTSAVVEYLGHVVEAQRDGKFDAILIGNSEPSGIDYTPCNLASNQKQCEPLFVVSHNAGTGAAFGISYRGTPYVIPFGERQVGSSNYALGIVKQLIGLNNSSKSSPTPAVLTGIPTL